MKDSNPINKLSKLGQADDENLLLPNAGLVSGFRKDTNGLFISHNKEPIFQN